MSRWTVKDIAAKLAANPQLSADPGSPAPTPHTHNTPPQPPPHPNPPAPKASISSHEMNKLEAAYHAILHSAQLAGTVLQFDFEPESLRIADRTTYTPDFRVIRPDGTVEFHETKGFWEDDARVKFKVCSALHPYVFVALRKRNKSEPWRHEVWRGGHRVKGWQSLVDSVEE